MREKTQKIIVGSAIIIISLSVVFSLFKVALAPVAPTTPTAPTVSDAALSSASPTISTISDVSLSSTKASTKSSTNLIQNFLIKTLALKAGEPKESPKLPLAEPKSITLIFGGDVMLSRRVNDQMVKNNDYAWPFKNIAAYLNSANLTIINLESPFADAKNYFVPTGSFSFKTDPQAVAGLLKSGLDLVALANNHILNQGMDGLKTTIKILTANNIKMIGAGENETAARHPEIFTVQNKKFGFLNYSYLSDNSVATDDRAGVADMNIEKMVAEVADLKKEADFVTVIIHAGEEYTTRPNEQQTSFAHHAIESGADLIIGHHPHWPQIIEFYQEKPIIYSLGNLIFDQMWSEETRLGLIAEINTEVNSENVLNLKEIKLIPIKIFDYGQAQFLEDGPEKEALFKKLDLPANGIIKL